MRKKKILYIITKGNWGGAQRYVFDLATNLPSSEFEMAVTSGSEGALTEKLRTSGIRTILLSSLQRDVSLGKELQTLYELTRLFKKERPDIVHVNSSKAALLGSLAARLFRFSLLSKVKSQKSKVPHIIFTVHGWPFSEDRNALWKSVVWCASYLTALLSRAIIVVSEHDRTLAEHMPFIGGKTVRIYNGIAPLSLGSGKCIRAAFPPGARITGTIGELTRNKNQEALIEEARRDQSLSVAIVGEGELRFELESLIRKYNLQDRVKLFGYIPAVEALRGFDAFVLPSLKEGLPYVLLEARAAGLSIVANRVGGVNEILDSKNPEEFTLETMLKKTLAVYSN